MHGDIDCWVDMASKGEDRSKKAKSTYSGDEPAFVTSFAALQNKNLVLELSMVWELSYSSSFRIPICLL